MDSYGSHPVYLEHRYDQDTAKSEAHGVFLFRFDACLAIESELIDRRLALPVVIFCLLRLRTRGYRSSSTE
jgi:hypothetical protein